MKKIDWKNVQDAVEIEKLPAGGYVCVITQADDVPDKEYLKIEFEIYDGEHRDFFGRASARLGFWPGRFIKSYKNEQAMRFFKGMLTAVKESNSGFIFNDDEKNLIGKMVGLTIAEEEYKKADGNVGKRYYVDQILSVDRIRSGDFKMPEDKLLSGIEKIGEIDGFQAIPDDDLPF